MPACRTTRKRMPICYSATGVIKAIRSQRAEANDLQRNHLRSRQEKVTCPEKSFHERKKLMRTSVVGKIFIKLLFALMIGGLLLVPAFGDNDHRGGPKQQGRHDNRRWQDDRRWHDDRGRYRYQPQTIYAPPPIYYAPEPSPGISIFFPPIHIR
jgi:hypothetical protein